MYKTFLCDGFQKSALIDCVVVCLGSGYQWTLTLMLLSRSRTPQDSKSFPWTSIKTRATCSGSWRNSCRSQRYRTGWRLGRSRWASWFTWNNAFFNCRGSFLCFPSACGGWEDSSPPLADRILKVERTGRPAIRGLFSTAATPMTSIQRHLCCGSLKRLSASI